MKGRALLALLALLVGSSAAHAEKLTVALSTPEIQINSNFTGTNVTIFGVIERDAGTVARVAPYEVAALILGPPETVVARRKDRFLGIWINGASETIVAAPTFYSLATSPGIDVAPPRSFTGSAHDLDGRARDVDIASAPNLDGVRDLGAYERQARYCGADDTMFCDGFEFD